MTDWDKNIELRSDPVREIIGKTPSWLVRWGTLSFAMVLMVLVLGSAWFSYPDRLTSRITISSDRPPVEIVAKNSGYLVKLFIQDSHQVTVGQELALLESSVDYDFISGIRGDLDSLKSWIVLKDTSRLLDFIKRDRAQPGSVKDEFAYLRSAVSDYISFITMDRYSERIFAAKKELRDTKIHFDRLFQQRQLRNKDLKLSEKQLLRQKELFDNGVISELEFEAASQESMQKQFQFEETRSGLSLMQIQIDRLEHQIVEYQIQDKEDERALVISIEEKLTGLIGTISEWEVNYLFRSPVDGRVSLTRYWAENQKIMKGDRVMTVVQNEPDILLGKLELPVVGSGKVAIGHKVLVKLDKYPYMEYGMLIGLVNSISLVTEQEFYLVEVTFPNGLLSSYSKDLLLTQGMTGKAEIITDNMSFLVRIVNPIRSLLAGNRQIQ
ncbi:MAG: hypothetical protein U9N86_10465 [Bacteroidota bacterium]|nr:hypothetical protein [Bacteroidota bacterium]